MQKRKEALISGLIAEGALRTPAVIEAFRSVPRENFVLPQYREYAYANDALPLIAGQTISQPYTVAVMTEALQPHSGQRILEIGAGSGYQAAILAEIVGHSGKIITIERLPELVDYAKERLKGRSNVSVILGDGSLGFAQQAPYDRIIVTASAPGVPEPLLAQLRSGGRMVIPVGDALFLVEKKKIITTTYLGAFVFVPLIGEHGHKNSRNK